MVVRRRIAMCFVCLCARMYILLCTSLSKKCRGICKPWSYYVMSSCKVMFDSYNYNHVGTYFYLKLNFKPPSSSYLSKPYLSLLKKSYLSFHCFIYGKYSLGRIWRKRSFWSDWCANRCNTHTHKGRVHTLKQTPFLLLGCQETWLWALWRRGNTIVCVCVCTIASWQLVQFLWAFCSTPSGNECVSGEEPFPNTEWTWRHICWPFSLHLSG